MPETHVLIKYGLIAFFALFGVALAGHIAKHGVSWKLPDPSKPLFAKRTAEEERREFREDLIIGAAMLCGLLLLGQCTGA